MISINKKQETNSTIHLLSNLKETKTESILLHSPYFSSNYNETREQTCMSFKL